MSKGSARRKENTRLISEKLEKIFGDPEREAYEAINRCRTFEEAQACLKSNEQGENCPVCGLKQ